MPAEPERDLIKDIICTTVEIQLVQSPNVDKGNKSLITAKKKKKK